MTKSYEYIFVGSGVAAVTVAKRLLESQPTTSILMLDAGPKVPAKERRAWWDQVIYGRKPYDYCTDIPGEHSTVGDISWGYEESRIMAYGGSTGHWGGWSLRYKPEDFEMRDLTKEGANWPLKYDDLRNYYYEAENYLSVCGNVKESWNDERKDQPYPLPGYGWTAADGRMIEAFDDLKIEAGQMPIARYRKCMTTGTCKYCPIGARFTAQAELDELLRNPNYSNVEQKCLAPATELIVGAKETIRAVKYLDATTGKTHRVEGKTVIVCAGTYESPKLLSRSVSTAWPDGIGNEHDLLGRYIVSHSFLRVMGEFSSNPQHWVQEYDFPTLMSRTYDTPEYQKQGKIFLFKNRALPNVDIAKHMIAGKSRADIQAILAGPMVFELQAFFEEKGQWRNRLLAKRGTNRFGLPLTEIHYLRSDDFQQHTEKRLKLMEAVFKKMGCRITASTPDPPGGHHATGTCRMALTPDEGVTDGDMKVHGTENLYVCSNAAFPTCSAVNPTLTLVAMSMRLGDRLLGISSSARKQRAGP